MKKFIIAATFLIFLLFIAACGDKNSVSPADSENTDEDVMSDENDEDSDSSSIFGEMTLNPSGNIPLSATVKIISTGIAKISVEVADIKKSEKPFTKEFIPSEEKTEVFVPVLGLFPDYKNIVTVKAYDSKQKLIEEKLFEIQTANLPKDFPTVETEGTVKSGWTMVNWLRTPKARPETNAIAVDELGRIRWFTDFPFANTFPLTIKDEFFYTSDGISTLYKFDFMGYEQEKWDVSKFGFTEIHHDIFIKDDGNILMGVSKIDDDFIEDRVIEINPEINQIRGIWNLTNNFPDVCDLYYDVPLTTGKDPAGLANDPVHNNAVYHDSRDDSLIIGSQRSGIAKMTHSGYLKWFMAPHITAFIDDTNNDGLSDSLVDGYDANTATTRVGDFKGDAYIDDRMPIGGKPHEDYSTFDFRYPEFLLTPLDSSGKPITDKDVLMGFTNHADFSWPFRAHNPTILKNGNMMVFDNGLARNFGFPPISKNSYSRAVEFEIVPDKTDGYGGTVKQVWEYVIEESPLWYGFSPVIGGASELENGNRLIVSGAVGSSFIPDQLKPSYDEGPMGALIIEVDPKTNTELNRLLFRRYIDADYPQNEFSAYRGFRFELKGVLK